MLKTLHSHFIRVEYNPADPKHRKVFARFMAEGKWNTTCPFFLEEPYSDIVSMCLNKTVKYYMSRERTTAEFFNKDSVCD